MSFSAPGSPPPESPGQQPYAGPPIPEQAPPVPPQGPPIPQQGQQGQQAPPQAGPYATGPYPVPAAPYAAQPPVAPPYPGQAYPPAAYPATAYPGQPYAQYPGQAYPGPPPAVDSLRSPQGLATALTVLLSIAAAVNLFLTGVCAYGWSLMTDLTANPFKVSDSALTRADGLTAAAVVFQTLLLLATGAVFIVWFYRVRQNGQIFRPDAFTLSRGWAIGGWFVPLGNLVLPFIPAKQTWIASTQFGPDGSYRRVSTLPVTAWWLVWVAALITDRVFSALYDRATTPEKLGTTYVVGAVDGLLTVAAAVLAILFVRKLTGMQNTKAAQGPNAAL
ncbi:MULTISPECIES: DUF4328 domain-containing protein [unclassified Streptomyces]|uniref:DUF4328 domain-containing protein n=1 Tax=unclassified Streptomyces TaxID=2593676 RepID=UPI001BEC6D10|nr:MULTISPECIES: DUF4328 domain-containing protein [unclassified Streptomyces]MBT2407981.1 DUF4328 domain-containing protein [Streptomyces sp. ISL-21]MBT2613361.1 DUF4328 domain-containing protein [Streptomyces sp. ISL-87]